MYSVGKCPGCQYMCGSLPSPRDGEMHFDLSDKLAGFSATCTLDFLLGHIGVHVCN